MYFSQYEYTELKFSYEIFSNVSGWVLPFNLDVS